jgi:hypothetical protein
MGSRHHDGYRCLGNGDRLSCFFVDYVQIALMVKFHVL